MEWKDYPIKKMFFKDVASFRIRAAERVFLFIIQYRHFIMISSMRTSIMKEARSRFSQIWITLRCFCFPGFCFPSWTHLCGSYKGYLKLISILDVSALGKSFARAGQASQLATGTPYFRFFALRLFWRSGYPRHDRSSFGRWQTVPGFWAESSERGCPTNRPSPWWTVPIPVSPSPCAQVFLNS